MDTQRQILQNWYEEMKFIVVHFIFAMEVQDQGSLKECVNAPTTVIQFLGHATTHYVNYIACSSHSIFHSIKSKQMGS